MVKQTAVREAAKMDFPHLVRSNFQRRKYNQIWGQFTKTQEYKNSNNKNIHKSLLNVDILP